MPFLLISNAGFTPGSVDSTADRVTAFLIVAFAQGKFYLLFSFLFGYSLTLALRRVDGNGLRRYRRRLVGLAVLGAAHAMFFFVGDILVSYAFLGIVLLWFVPRSDTTALRGAAVALLTGWVLLALLVWSAAATDTATTTGFVTDSTATDQAFAGTFMDAAGARLNVLPQVAVVFAFLNWAPALAMFLLGLVSGRRRLLAHPQGFPCLWRRLLVLAAVVGIPGGIASAVLTHGPGAETADGLRQALGVALGFGTAPALTAGYVALAAIATRSRFLRAVQPAGRMSLTGYLGESIALSAIACGWGLGALGQLNAMPAALVAITVWLAFEVFARTWLTHFTYGPSEWLLRCWTYRRAVPLRAHTGAAPDSSW